MFLIFQKYFKNGLKIFTKSSQDFHKNFPKFLIELKFRTPSETRIRTKFTKKHRTRIYTIQKYKFCLAFFKTIFVIFFLIFESFEFSGTVGNKLCSKRRKITLSPLNTPSFINETNFLYFYTCIFKIKPGLICFSKKKIRKFRGFPKKLLEFYGIFL